MLYNFGLVLLLLLSFPKILYQRIRYQKYKKTLLFRLGLKPFFFSIPKGKKVFWVHGVSLGEAKSGLIFLEHLKKNNPDIFIVFSTITQTGMEAVQKSSLVDLSFYLPIDFSWTMRRLARQIQPDFLCLIETDIWFHFLKYMKKSAKIFFISAKLSDRSFKRLKTFSFFTKKLFQPFDHICLQTQEGYQKFIDLKIASKKLTITGNLKYDQKKQIIDTDRWKKKLSIQDTDCVITLASTHAPEEVLLLETLKPIFPKVKILIAPRHPERFLQVQKIIKSYETHNITLIDQMGLLPVCFSLSQLAIIGGSFTQIGGHNILEPALYHIPVLFGPYMHAQKELVSIVKSYHLGWQIDLRTLLQKVQHILNKPFEQDPKFAKEVQGSSEKTLQALAPYLKILKEGVVVKSD